MRRRIEGGLFCRPPLWPCAYTVPNRLCQGGYFPLIASDLFGFQRMEPERCPVIFESKLTMECTHTISFTHRSSIPYQISSTAAEIDKMVKGAVQ